MSRNDSEYTVVIDGVEQCVTVYRLREVFKDLPAWTFDAASTIMNQWSVGSFSRFMDDPVDFDEAEKESVAAVIYYEYLKTQAARSNP